MTSMQNLSTYASVFLVVPILAALVALQTLHGMDLKYISNIAWGLASYWAAIAIVCFVLFRHRKDGLLTRGVMAGIVYGFLDAAIANLSRGVPIVHEIFTMPALIARPMGFDVLNPIIYVLSFIVFWAVVFGVAARIAESHTRKETVQP